MSFESDNAQRNTTLDRLKQQTPPTLADQQPNLLYTMPVTTVERLEEVLRRTLALQETIRADTERLATKENLKELATGQQLVDWLNQANSIHQGICRDLRQTVQEMKEEHKQDGRRRDEFMRKLSELEAQFRRNWDEASARFQGKILLTILASGIVSAVVSVLMWRVLLYPGRSSTSWPVWRAATSKCRCRTAQPSPPTWTAKRGQRSGGTA